MCASAGTPRIEQLYQDLFEGRTAPVAVKVTDMLGEEVLVVLDR